MGNEPWALRSSGPRRACLEGWQRLGQYVVGRTHPRDCAVSKFASQAEGIFAQGRGVDRHRGFTNEFRVHVEVLALELNSPLPEQSTEHGEVLTQVGEGLFHRDAIGTFDGRTVARANAEAEAPRCELMHDEGLLGHDNWMTGIGRHDCCPELDSRCANGGCSKGRERIRASRAGDRPDHWHTVLFSAGDGFNHANGAPPVWLVNPNPRPPHGGVPLPPGHAFLALNNMQAQRNIPEEQDD